MSEMSSGWALVLKSLISIIGLIVLIYCGIGLLPWLRRKIAPDPVREHTMVLRNRSNFPCAFEVGFLADEPTLRGDFFWMGAPLPKARVVKTITSQAQTIGGHGNPQATSTSQPSRLGATAPDLSKAKSKLTLLSPIVGILSGLGGLIPGSLGASMKATANTMRQSQMDARIALEAPNVAKKQVSAISSQSAKVLGKSATSPTAQTRLEDATPTTAHEFIEERSEPNVITVEEEIPDRFISKPVNEGEEITLTLRLRWAKLERAAFSKVYSLSVAQKPIGNEVTPPSEVEHEGFATFSGSRLRDLFAARFAQVLSFLFLLTLQASLLFWVWVA